MKNASVDERALLLIRDIDRKVNNTIHPSFYYRFVLEATRSRKKARAARDHVILAARFILLLDRYYESEKEQYREAAENARTNLFERLSAAEKKKFQERYRNISSFWAYEASLRNKKRFTQEERAVYIRKKSSDVLLYTLVAGFVHPFPWDVVEIFHAVQQLQDIYDDLKDTREDRGANSPNLVFLFSWDYRSPRDLKPDERVEIAEMTEHLLKQTRLYAEEVPYILSCANKYSARIAAMFTAPRT